MAIDFPGTDEYIDCGSSAGLDNMGYITISCLANLDVNTAGFLVQKGDNVTTCWALYLKGAGVVDFYQGRATTAGLWSYAAPTTGVWHHIAVAYSNLSTGTVPNVYIDGSSVTPTSAAQGEGAAINDSAYSLTVGAYGGVPAGFVNGRLEDVRVFNQAKSATAMAALAGGYRGPIGDEVLWLPMSEVDGATLSSAAAVVFDMSGNGNHGTPQGGCLGVASCAPRMNGWIP